MLVTHRPGKVEVGHASPSLLAKMQSDSRKRSKELEIARNGQELQCNATGIPKRCKKRKKKHKNRDKETNAANVITGNGGMNSVVLVGQTLPYQSKQILNHLSQKARRL